MATAPLRVSAPQSPYRDCDIAFAAAAGQARAMCNDAATGLIIGNPSIPPGRRNGRQHISAEDVIRLMGGTYRLASIALEIEAEELAQQTRRISDELRLRRRLWRRRKRPVKLQPDLIRNG